MARRHRGKRANDYARKAPVKDPYDVVLIVCEGGKTEPNYFGRLCKVCGVTSANVTPANGTDPVSVVKYAISQYDDHDRIYCVFDRNGHPNFDEAVMLAAQSNLGRKGKLTTITSVPCFEEIVGAGECLSDIQMMPKRRSSGMMSSGPIA
jgi:hypothetical protein